MAGTGSATWNGTVLPLPGTYGFVDPSGLSFPGSPDAPVVYLIGNSVGGQPKTVLGPFSSYSEAAQVLRGGDLLNAVRFAFKAGAGRVAAYRPFSATQSSLILRDASANPSIVLTSADWGSWTNSLAASISGTVPNLVATLVNLKDQTTFTSPGLGGVIQLAYTGNGTSAAVTVAHGLQAPAVGALTANTTGGSIPASTTVYIRVVARNASGISAPSSEVSVTTGSSSSTNSVTVPITADPAATSYDIYVGTSAGAELYYGNVKGQASGTINATVTSIPSGTSAVPTQATARDALVTWVTGATDGSQSLDVNLDNANVSTCRGLVGFLNGQTGYSAQLSSGAGGISSTQIDAVTNQSITGSGYLLTSAIGTVVNWFNSTGLVTAAAASGATQAPAQAGLTPFAGGSDGTATATDWQSAANQIQTFSPFLRYTVPLTSDPAIMQAVLQAIVAAATPPAGLLGEGFFGGAIGETQAQAKQNAASLNSRRAVYAGRADFFDYDANFVVQRFPGYMMAAYFAGLRAGLSPQTPLTGKLVNVLKLAQRLSVAELNDLNRSGVAAPKVNEQGLVEISLGTTTDISSQDYTNLYYVEESVGNSVDSLIAWLVSNLNRLFKGQPNYGARTSNLLLAEINSELTVARDTYHWIADFDKATTVTQLPTNPTFLVVPVTVRIVEPINGVIVPIALQLPVQAASA